MTSKRQMRRRANRAAFWKAKHESANTPAEKERVARDEWLATLDDLESAERDRELARQAAELSERTIQLRRRQ